jgi:hypothetical protein
MLPTEQLQSEIERITIQPADRWQHGGEACVLRFTVTGVEPVSPIRTGDEGGLIFRGTIGQSSDRGAR